ncbi:hypothetical protein H3C61_00435 [Candidatus Gracilibacteria bacterium]|nr:hypothetical protein [Candidatus Gracilibacteria bacterium]
MLSFNSFCSSKGITLSVVIFFTKILGTNISIILLFSLNDILSTFHIYCSDIFFKTSNQTTILDILFKIFSGAFCSFSNFFIFKLDSSKYLSLFSSLIHHL